MNYVTINDEDGINYREISKIMTAKGFKINHSSARNYTLRAMKKFAANFSKYYGLNLSDEKISDISKTPLFQKNISNVLHVIDSRDK